jgi:hypothetical protein
MQERDAVLEPVVSTKARLIVSVFLAFIGFWPTPILAQAPGAKKLIYYGWGSPDTQYVRDHWRQMEEMPFDGVGIVVPIDLRAWQQGQRNTRNQFGWQVMGKRPFRVEEFREAIEDLKVAKWRKFTDNFLPVALSAEMSAAGLNWFDDGRWRTVANNFAVLARIATEGGLKGFIFDPEAYAFKLFHYPTHRAVLDKPFAAYQEKARERGREVMTAIAAAKPDPVIISLYVHSYVQLLRQLYSKISLQDNEYGLLPAFYDGILEAMPSGGVLVDGYEQAYGFKERRQFTDGHWLIQEAIKFSAVPEHYKKKVKAGFGLWLDNTNKPNYFTPEEFQRAVSSALKVSDGYVWIYSQGPRFFPPSGLAPSYIKALAAARDDASE